MNETGYESVEDATLHSRQMETAAADNPSSTSYSVGSNSTSKLLKPAGSVRSTTEYYDYTSVGSVTMPAVLEIPEEVYSVRKAALKILKPMTKTWIVISVGFSLTVLFGMARWTLLMPGLPLWLILLPCWSSHVGLLWLHVLAARALSRFISDANESRNRPDSRDHINRTEYLPLLQRALNTLRLSKGTITLTAALVPLWLLVTGGILDGVICKTQPFIRLVCWALTFASMVLLVMKVDYGYDELRWRTVTAPVIAILSIASATLIYIVYGHQVGYYRLTEAQLTAGNLYSMAALICIVLVVMIGEFMPLSRPVEMESRLLIVVLAPLVVSLVGMGAWVVSRDEFGRLLLYGGQSSVHPKRLKWEDKGWTGVQAKGVTVIPMFGEVRFQPLTRSSSTGAIEMCSCCSCYPYMADDDEEAQLQTSDSYFETRSFKSRY